VLVTKAFHGICHMQVCTVKDATDEEILGVCNRENPSGTQAGWTRVVRQDEEHRNMEPVQCGDDAERLHILVAC
jgi:hypothetical protein